MFLPIWDHLNKGGTRLADRSVGEHLRTAEVGTGSHSQHNHTGDLMRNKREIYALVITGIIAGVVLVGFLYLDSDAPMTGRLAPEKHEMETDAPNEVDETPPSASGTIDEP